MTTGSSDRSSRSACRIGPGCGSPSSRSPPDAERERLESLKAIYEILDERYSSGDPLASARHEEMEDASWTAGVNREWAEDWKEAREDIYTVNDGEPLEVPR
jgi:hypothetical protein